ncbi:hypothetical protein EDB81DRAFT_465206 [Dactylonectria macrodidyma]|uniref:Uncharacterized protein n=1 Tax=Dactylonectria macrodidyma TaxID=307937 RepID=A0A9P9J7N7_9HYPO|nr:hypothetical protein EDB81DRAFT_465206 [Dactylonectria macrodidyma]
MRHLLGAHNGRRVPICTPNLPVAPPTVGLSPASRVPWPDALHCPGPVLSVHPHLRLLLHTLGSLLASACGLCLPPPSPNPPRSCLVPNCPLPNLEPTVSTLLPLPPPPRRALTRAFSPRFSTPTYPSASSRPPVPNSSHTICQLSKQTACIPARFATASRFPFNLIS